MLQSGVMGSRIARVAAVWLVPGALAATSAGPPTTAPEEGPTTPLIEHSPPRGPCSTTATTPSRITVELFDYDVAGRRVGSRLYLAGEDPSTAKPRRQTFVEYDAEGRRSKEVSLSPEGVRVEVFEYDSRGLLIASQEDHRGDGTFVLRHERVYGDQDRLVLRRTLDLRHHPAKVVMERTLRYDARGRLAGEEISDEGAVESVHVVIDEAGRVTVRVRDLGSDGTTDEVQTFVYDEAGRLSQTVFERGGDRETTEHRYDAEGRLHATLRTGADGTILSRVEHDYGCRTTPA